MAGHGQGTRPGSVPFAPQAKKALELSLREALAMGHHYIGTEHILLGLLREGQGAGAQVLSRLGTDHAQLQEQVLDLLACHYGQAGPRAQLDRAAALRDLDRQLLADKLRLEDVLADRPRPAIRARHQPRHRYRPDRLIIPNERA